MVTVVRVYKTKSQSKKERVAVCPSQNGNWFQPEALSWQDYQAVPKLMGADAM